MSLDSGRRFLQSDYNFGGLTDAEASDRKFVLAAFRYGRTLAANDSLALQYTLDAIPLALATGNIVSSTSSFGVTTFDRETAYGAGLTPLGLQLDISNSGTDLLKIRPPPLSEQKGVSS